MIDNNGLKRGVFFTLLIITAALTFAVSAEANVKLTFINKTNVTVSVALAWQGFDESHSKGWYNVKPGESRTISVNVAAALTVSGTYYHAKAKGLVWQGTTKYPIRPKEAFDYVFGNIIPRGSTLVGFRNIKLTIDGNREDGWATVTLKR